MDRLALLPAEGLYEEYRIFGDSNVSPKKGHDLGDYEFYHKVRGARWPVVNRKRRCGATARALILRRGGQRLAVLWATRTRRRTSSRCRTTRAAEAPDAEYDLWLCTGECSSTGTPAP